MKNKLTPEQIKALKNAVAKKQKAIDDKKTIRK